MSVYRTDYLMWGVDVGYDAFDWGEHEAEAEGSPEARFDVILDGMCGKYCIAGKIIAKADQYDGFEMRKLDVDAIKAIDRADIARKVAGAFGKDIGIDDISLILFSHFS